GVSYVDVLACAVSSCGTEPPWAAVMAGQPPAPPGSCQNALKCHGRPHAWGRGPYYAPTGTVALTRGSPTERVVWPWPVRSSARTTSPGPKRRVEPSPIPISICPSRIKMYCRRSEERRVGKELRLGVVR